MARKASLRRADLQNEKEPALQSRERNLPWSCPSRRWPAPSRTSPHPHPHPWSTQYLDDIEAGAVLSPSSDADPNQVLSILLQGHLPRHSRDSARKTSI